MNKVFSFHEVNIAEQSNNDLLVLCGIILGFLVIACLIYVPIKLTINYFLNPKPVEEKAKEDKIDAITILVRLLGVVILGIYAIINEYCKYIGVHLGLIVSIPVYALVIYWVVKYRHTPNKERISKRADWINAQKKKIKQYLVFLWKNRNDIQKSIVVICVIIIAICIFRIAFPETKLR